LQIISAAGWVVFWWCIDWNNQGLTLFVIDAFVCGVLCVAEAHRPPAKINPPLSTRQLGSNCCVIAVLLIYVLVNIIFTTYSSLRTAALPQNFVPVGNSEKGFAESTIGALFSWHLALPSSLSCPLPVPQATKHSPFPPDVAVGFKRSGLQALLQRLSSAGLALGVLRSLLSLTHPLLPL